MGRQERDERAELEAAIDELYVVFARYARPPWFPGCECCWGPILPGSAGPDPGYVRVEAPGGDRPLRELTGYDLCDVATQMPGLGGTPEVYKHYLPRVLELAASGGLDRWTEVDSVLHRLYYSDDPREQWVKWPVEEQAAVRAFLRELWRSWLAEGQDDDRMCRLDDVLCGIGLADPDIDWYLATWLEFEHPNAAVNLEAFLQENAAKLARGALASEFWSHGRASAAGNHDRIIEWTKAEATKAKVAAAAERARTPAEREALDECYLRWLGP